MTLCTGAKLRTRSSRSGACDATRSAYASDSRCCRSQFEVAARMLLNKSGCDDVLVDAAAAVLLQCVQSGGNQRWRRLARDTAAAIQSIDDTLQTSVRQCDQASNNAKLQEAQVCRVQGAGCSYLSFSC
jgi:hypothetical protein